MIRLIMTRIYNSWLTFIYELTEIIEKLILKEMIIEVKYNGSKFYLRRFK